MNEDKRVPLYIHDHFDYEKQEEWIRRQKEEQEKLEKRGCEVIDFSIDEILIEEFMS